jgi:hypothetical protein
MKKYSFLGCDAVYSDVSLPTFRNIILLPSSGLKSKPRGKAVRVQRSAYFAYSPTLKMGTVPSFELSLNYQIIRRQMPEDSIVTVFVKYCSDYSL